MLETKVLISKTVDKCGIYNQIYNQNWCTVFIQRAYIFKNPSPALLESCASSVLSICSFTVLLDHSVFTFTFLAGCNVFAYSIIKYSVFITSQLWFTFSLLSVITPPCTFSQLCYSPPVQILLKKGKCVVIYTITHRIVSVLTRTSSASSVLSMTGITGI